MYWALVWCYTETNLFNPATALGGRYDYHHHFTDGKAEAQRS